MLTSGPDAAQKDELVRKNVYRAAPTGVAQQEKEETDYQAAPEDVVVAQVAVGDAERVHMRKASGDGARQRCGLARRKGLPKLDDATQRLRHEVECAAQAPAAPPTDRRATPKKKVDLPLSFQD